MSWPHVFSKNTSQKPGRFFTPLCKKEKMIDIHAHIIPGVDDGAKDMEESLSMLKKGWDSGISTVCATPHILKKVDCKFEQKILSGFDLLKKKITEKNLELKILLGSEVHISLDFENLKNFQFFTIDDNEKYLLLEFPLNHIPNYVEKIIFDLCLDGYVPVIAHPERSIIKEIDLKRLEKMANLGAFFQLNAGSLLGHFGKKVKKFSLKLLKNELIHFVASDAHDDQKRSIETLSEAFALIRNLVGERKVFELFYSNPQNLIQGKKIESFDWNLFSHNF